MQDFRRLAVWRAAHALALLTYRATQRFPSTERYGITSQMRRAASGIGANVAEGCGRGTDRDFARFLQIAVGSSCELESHVLLAADLGYLEAGPREQLIMAAARVRRALIALLKRVRPPFAHSS